MSTLVTTEQFGVIQKHGVKSTVFRSLYGFHVTSTSVTVHPQSLFVKVLCLISVSQISCYHQILSSPVVLVHISFAGSIFHVFFVALLCFAVLKSTLIVNANTVMFYVQASSTFTFFSFSFFSFHRLLVSLCI